MMHRRAAFTLIESLLSISIAATMLLALLALLSVGLGATREGTSLSTETRIFTWLRQQCSAAELSGDFYFDVWGQPLPTQTVEAVFAVRITPASAVLLPGDDLPTLRRIRLTLSDRMVDDPFAEARSVRVQHLLLPSLTVGDAP